MAIFGLFKRKTPIKDITNIQRADIVAMYEDGEKPSTIAEELNLDPDRVSKILDLEKRKMARSKKQSIYSTVEDDPVAKAMADLQAAKIELQIERLQFEKDKLEAEREDYFSEGDVGMPETGDKWTDFLAAMAMNFLKPNAQPQQQPPQYSPPMPQSLPQPTSEPIKQESPAVEPTNELDVEADKIIAQIPKTYIQAIRARIISKNECIAFANKKGITDEALLEHTYKKIMEMR